MDKLSIIIPCYRSEHTIQGVVEEIVAELDGSFEFEIILVNDASPDNVWEKIQALVADHGNRVKGIRFAKNFGQHAALMAGYRLSQGDIVIQMDDDGQTDPKGIFTLVDKIHEGYDVAFARYPEIKQSVFRRFGSAVNRKMCVALIDMPPNLKPTSFSAARRFVVEQIIRYERPYPYIGGLLFQSTSNMCDVEIQHRKRAYGISNYTIGKLLKLWLNGFTAFSVKPLEFGIIVGVLAALAGFVYAIIVTMRKLLGFPVLVGWSSLISIILMLGGFILIMLGLVGEYVGRIYISINNAPQYVIKDICENTNAPEEEAAGQTE
ncbi:MAG: glycosyltransferase family 2 protein [Lachnospiraceae bacterium]|nr:glycosyltransferase family 2 protein [Lachnospiraceae bacterium]